MTGIMRSEAMYGLDRHITGDWGEDMFGDGPQFVTDGSPDSELAYREEEDPDILPLDAIDDDALMAWQDDGGR